MKNFVLIFLFSFSFIQIIFSLQINDCNGLVNVVLNDSQVSYEFSRDIDCSMRNPFPIIGNSTYPFKGSIDGMGFSLLNININTSNETTSVGIFASTLGANFSNIVLSVTN
jgi:hypothetical protein